MSHSSFPVTSMSEQTFCHSLQRGLEKVACFTVGGVLGSRIVVNMTGMQGAFLGTLNGIVFALFDYMIGKTNQHPYVKLGAPILGMEIVRHTASLLGRVSFLLPTVAYGFAYLLSAIRDVVFPFLLSHSPPPSSTVFQHAPVIGGQDLAEVTLSRADEKRVKHAIEKQTSLLVRKLQASNESYAVSGSSLFCIVVMILAGLANAKDQQKVITQLGLQGMPIEKIYKGLAVILKEANASKQPSIQFASALVADPRALGKEFRSLAKYIFNAQYLPHNKDEINRFVREKTNQLIKKILDSDPGRGNMAINVACFTGLWVNQFTPLEEKESFHGVDEIFRAQFMEKKARMGLYEVKDEALSFKVIEQKYQTDAQGKACSFVIFMPEEGKQIGDLEEQLEDEAFLDQCFTKVSASSQKVHLQMPKMDIRTEIKDLKRMLEEAFGFEDGFPPLIKFDGNGIDKIVQECRILCDEKGTKAAAVTYMRTRGPSRPTPLIKVDRPFTFFIRYQGTTLFRGGIKNQKGMITSS